jgi:hypothetical protein
MEIDLTTKGNVVFLKPEDLDGDVVYRVAAVEMKEINDRWEGGLVPRMIGYFELPEAPGELRSFILNKTVQRQLAYALNDNDTENWIGHEVVLFRTMSNNDRPAIRVKPVERLDNSA